VIVATVALYGLTVVPAARRLGVTRPARTRPLLVGGAPWVIELGRALQSAGLEVVMWAGLDQQREQIRRAGLELAPGELLAAAIGRGARLEGITAVLLLTDEDDFNALAAVLLAESVGTGLLLAQTGLLARALAVAAPATLQPRSQARWSAAGTHPFRSGATPSAAARVTAVGRRCCGQRLLPPGRGR
jgi:hypothetical protein